MSDRSSHRQSSHTYSLIKPTGNGAFGMVYKAKDNQNGKIVAIKKDHDVTIANNIMKSIQAEFDNKMSISIQFEK